MFKKKGARGSNPSHLLQSKINCRKVLPLKVVISSTLNVDESTFFASAKLNIFYELSKFLNEKLHKNHKHFYRCLQIILLISPFWSIIK